MPIVARLTREDLEEWRAHPVTERVLAILRLGAEVERKGLQSQLWAKGECDREMLGRVKAAEDLIEDLTETTCEEWNEWAEAFEQKRD